ncbi:MULTISPECIES: urease subunit beta [Sporosarcina]|uniref:urease subunit beta n=1 Tax=Sporosarcina TaxID=1569 RepID=UPI00129BBD18|nr:MULTISPECIES: urease subunit beta [Sporosarcina]GKV63977.1 urease subunit beta [Sporosarcina sp. NCCP-2331]GLB54758.1 urease subunit beta [Sporosarcina sp. NCCP-2378]
MQPGELFLRDDVIIINKDRPITTLTAKNTGDRPIQVGSHYHFYEVNGAIQFEREKAFGKRLNIPAGAAVRFEPGDEKEIELICFTGKQRVYGFNNKVDGSIEGRCK